MQKVDSQISQLIKKYKEGVVSLCADLVKIPSVTGKDFEEKMVSLISSKAKSLGLPYKTIAKTKGRPNVFVGNNFSEKNGLLFVAHLDTAGIGDENKWKHKPFAAEIEDKKLYGRGAIDNKSGIVLSLFALKILKDLGKLDNAKFAGVADEEKGADSTIGARYLLDKGLNAKAAIYTYSGTDTITIGHRGQVKLWINVEGESAHTGSRGWQDGTRGASALEALINFLKEAQKIKLPGSHPAFPHYYFKQTPVFVNSGSVSAMVPDKAQALIDARLLPNHDNNKYIEAVKKLAKKFETDKLKISVEIQTNLPAAFIKPHERIVGILKKLSKDVLDVVPEIRGCGPANEGYMFIGAGIPTICGFGAHGDGAHSNDEYLDLESLDKILEIYVKSALLIK